MRIRLSLLMILVLVAPVVAAQSTAPVFERSIEFSPVRMSDSDLYRMVDRIRQQVEKANAGLDRRFERESLRLSSRQASIELANGFQESALRGAPEMATDMYFYYHLDGAPIEEISLRLADYSRTLTLSGTAPSQVDALIAMLTEDMSRYEVRIGGTSVRSLGGFLLSLLAWLVVAISASTSVPISSQRIRLVGVAIGLGLLIALFVAPWDQWLPGTAIYLGDPRFSVRYGALISLIGTVVTLAGFVLSVWSASRKDKSEASDDAA